MTARSHDRKSNAQCLRFWPVTIIQTDKGAFTLIRVLVQVRVIRASEVDTSRAFTVTCISTNICNLVTIKNLGDNCEIP